MDHPPSPEEARLEGERAQFVAAYKSTLADRDAALAKARRAWGVESEKWQHLKRKLTESNDKRQIIFAKLLRLTDGKRLPGWILVIGAVILAALEAPINKFMLDNILRGNNFDSYMFSLFLTLIALLLAHIAGTQARQIRGAYQETIYLSNILIVATISIVLSAFVGTLTIGRAFYSTTGPSFQGPAIFSEIGHTVQALGPWAALVAALGNKAALFLAAMNTAAIAGAFFIAFITHDSDKVYQAALDEVASTEKKLAKLAKKYTRVTEGISRQFGPTLTNTAAAYGALNGQIVGLKRLRNAALSDDDRLDLSQFDTLLSAARAEIRASIQLAERNAAPHVIEDTSAGAISQFMPRDRK